MLKARVLTATEIYALTSYKIRKRPRVNFHTEYLVGIAKKIMSVEPRMKDESKTLDEYSWREYCSVFVFSLGITK